MDFLFGKGKVKPTDLVKDIKDVLQQLEKKEKEDKKLIEELSKNLYLAKHALIAAAPMPAGAEGGSPFAGVSDPNHQAIVQELTKEIAALVNEIYLSDLPLQMILNLRKVDFEARKDIGTVIHYLLSRQVNGRFPSVDYMLTKPALVESLLTGHDDHNIAFQSGAILRDCLKHEALCKSSLSLENLHRLFTTADSPAFDLASNAFTTIREMLTVHKQMVADFLDGHYDAIFTAYTLLLNSNNYATKRQSLKLLSELLLDRANFTVMTKYISSVSNLKLMMTLLRSEHQSIRFEAFHVFKVFVANPNKPATIQEILVRNKAKLLSFLEKFRQDSEDEQFRDEKTYLMKQLQSLPDKV